MSAQTDRSDFGGNEGKAKKREGRITCRLPFRLKWKGTHEKTLAIKKKKKKTTQDQLRNPLEVLNLLNYNIRDQRKGG